MSEPQESESPPIVLDVRPYGQILEFKTVDELEKWVMDETAGWAPLLSKLGSSQPGSAGSTVISQRHAQLRQLIQEYRQSKNKDQARTQLIQQLAAQFPKQKRNELYIPAGSAAHAFVDRLFAEDPKRGGFALVILLRVSWANRGLQHEEYLRDDPSSLFSAIIDAEHFRRGIEARTDAEVVALTKLRQEWVDALRAHKELYETEVKAARQDIAKRNEAENAHDQRFDDVIAAGSKQLADELSDRKKQFDALSETYAKQLALQSSVRYWRRRAWFATVATLVLAIAVAAGGVALVLYLDKTVVRPVTSVQGAPTTTAPASASAQQANPAPAASSNREFASPWLRFWIAPVIFLLGAWGIRMLTRFMYSNYEAAASSFEKATMVESFLALMKDAQGLPPESIKILLGAIFHPPVGRTEGEPMVDPGFASTASTAVRTLKR